jgi:ribosomal protein S18 acetylase RimI-like enzyme
VSRGAVEALSVSPLRGDEVVGAAALLGRAFRENPLNRAVVGGSPERRERANRAGMRAHLPVARTAGSVLAARLGGELAGVLAALPPGALAFGRPSWPALVRLLLVQGPRVAGRWAAISDALQLHRPRAPHAHLATLGVEPVRQRQGVGRALLGHWLAEIDSARARAYLETDSADNARWYESFGFATRAELTLLGVRVYLMERGAAPHA